MSILTKTRALLSRLFIHNGYYKLLAAALVLILYSWINGERDSQLSVFTQVRMAVPKSLVLTSPPIDRVKITVQGRFSTLNKLNSESIEPVFVDLSAKSPKDDIVRLTEDMIRLPPGLRVTSIQPSFIRITLKEKSTKTVPIRMRVVGEPPEGYIVGDTKISPTQVKISGPREAVDHVRVTLTEPIDLSDRKESFTERVELRHEDPIITDDLQVPVEVTVQIKTRSVERTIEEIPVMAVNTNLDTSVTPSTVKITLKGPQKLLEQVKRDKLLAAVDMSAEARQEGTYLKEVKIRNLPKDITLVTVHPTDFRVTTRRPAPRENEN